MSGKLEKSTSLASYFHTTLHHLFTTSKLHQDDQNVRIAYNHWKRNPSRRTTGTPIDQIVRGSTLCPIKRKFHLSFAAFLRQKLSDPPRFPVSTTSLETYGNVWKLQDEHSMRKSRSISTTRSGDIFRNEKFRKYTRLFLPRYASIFLFFYPSRFCSFLFVLFRDRR